MHKTWLLFALVCLAAGPGQAAEAGFAMISVPDPGGEPLQVGVWYPTPDKPSDQRLNLFMQPVALNGAVESGLHPLIVFSHGNMGSLDNHYDTALALAQAGFVVAAMTHTGDTYRDQSHATDLPARPRAVHAVIDHMLGAWPQRASVDPAQIGMLGFSSGGFTALVAIGGIPNLASVTPYCATHPQTYVCGVVRDRPTPAAIADTAWVADGRIKAAVVAAPAIGFAFAPSGLRAVRIPVQLWQAGDDHILPSPDYVEPVRAALPQPPEYHLVAGADHFDFLAPCSDALAHVAPMVCQEHGGFDRAAFHRDFNAAVVRFFTAALIQ